MPTVRKLLLKMPRVENDDLCNVTVKQKNNGAHQYTNNSGMMMDETVSKKNYKSNGKINNENTYVIIYEVSWTSD